VAETQSRTAVPVSRTEIDSAASGKFEIAGGPISPCDLEHHPIVFFDGVCGLCNRFIDFTLRRDRRGALRFAPLQGTTARDRLDVADVRDLKTVVFVDEHGAHRQSAAIIGVLSRLGGFWALVSVLLRLVPRPLRDAGYSLIAVNRYAIFGRKEMCRLPTPAEQSRFLP